MPIIVGHGRIDGDVAREIARLESLLGALERVGNGEMPTARELDAAPLLSPYTYGTRSLPCLPRNAAHCRAGGNTGHPVLRGPIVRTTEVWVMCPGGRWARTLTRLYLLQSCALQEGELMRTGDEG